MKKKTNRPRRFAWLIPILAVTGCEAFRPATAPLRTLHYEKSSAPPSQSTLLVLLPGRRSAPEDFEKYGLIDLIPEGANIDVAAVDAHMGYYRGKNIDVRLLEDVIRPAREKGYQRIELLGISLGGLGSLFFSLNQPGEIDRITLLAPFLGEEEIVAEIRDAGGLGDWDPGTIEEDDYQRELWSGLKGQLSSESPEIRIGFGSRDRHRGNNEFFSDSLLNGDRETVDGGHDWKAWRTLFEKYYGA